MPSTPEAIYTIYGLNKIGAIAVPVDPRSKEDKLKEYIENINPHTILTLDLCYELVSKISSNYDVDNIVTVTATESLPILLKSMQSIISKVQNKSIKECDGTILWRNFLKNGKKVKSFNSEPIDGNEVVAIIYTGGTTGKKKVVQLTNNNVNAMVKQHEVSGIPFSQGQKFLDFLPPFIAYGLVNAIHMPLCLGFEIQMIPIFEPKDFPKLVYKNKPSYIFASPVHYEKLMEYNGKKDFSFADCIVSGGDSMSKEMEEEINKDLLNHGSKIKLGQGLGMTEASGTISVPLPDKIKTGSVGLPFPNATVGVFDQETNEELSYNEKGELCFSGPSLMKGYFNDQEETDKVLKKHNDGKVWLHTGDIAYIDHEGYVFFVDRIKRIINRGGLKVYPSEVEKIILSHPNVSSCVVVGVNNEEERHVPIAHIILENKLANDEQEIINLCDIKLDDESIPYGIKFREEIPYTPNGKIDYKKLENEGYEDVVLSKPFIKTLKK